MFNIGGAELILILLVAFLIVGPKDLPKVARALGRWVRMLKQMFEDFKEETGLDDTLEDFKDVERDISTTIREVDPRMELKDAEREARKAIGEAEKSVKAGMGKTNKK